ncbi:hypothetical protein HYDPIDRAFT_112981 [Hydnomerulius pinastri MD-312]|uniref:Uncharacterized protein n=1 Tax=Hydnomerulius pinastri MD-312 TaxID=994086 RepID=A0A0C9VYU0_9AGAM|nr:hypothetical protein HYDPIDRAFT_112981 [Hydnomerulius pinastri MD-312]
MPILFSSSPCSKSDRGNSTGDMRGSGFPPTSIISPYLIINRLSCPPHFPCCAHRPRRTSELSHTKCRTEIYAIHLACFGTVTFIRPTVWS